MQKLFYNKCFFICLLLSVSMASLYAPRTRSQFLLDEHKQPSNTPLSLASDYVKKVVRKDDGKEIVKELKEKEKEVMREIKQAEKQANIHKKKMRQEERMLQKDKRGKLTLAEEVHKKKVAELEAQLLATTQEIEEEAAEKIAELKSETEAKAVQILNRAQQEGLKKMNQAEEEALKKHFRVKYASPKELEMWKENIRKEHITNVDYLKPILEQDKELYTLFDNESKLIDAKITGTEQLNDKSYSFVMKKLTPQSLMRKVHQKASAILQEQLNQTTLRPEQQRKAKLITLYELPPLIKKQIDTNEEISELAIQKLVMQAIDESKEPIVSPLKAQLEEEIKTREALQKRIEQLVKEKESLQKLAQQTKQVLTEQEAEEDESLEQMQKNIAQLNDKLKVTQLAEQEHLTEISNLQKKLHQSEIDHLKVQMEAAKVSQLHARLNNMQSNLKLLKSEHQVCVRDLSNAETKMIQLQADEQKQAMFMQIKEKRHEREAEGLRKKNVVLQKKLGEQKKKRELLDQSISDLKKISADINHVTSGTMSSAEKAF